MNNIWVMDHLWTGTDREKTEVLREKHATVSITDHTWTGLWGNLFEENSQSICWNADCGLQIRSVSLAWLEVTRLCLAQRSIASRPNFSLLFPPGKCRHMTLNWTTTISFGRWGGITFYTNEKRLSLAVIHRFKFHSAYLHACNSWCLGIM